MIDERWTLFLDRDGVLNQDHVGGYVIDKKEFILYEGVLAAMKQFAGQFSRILICTNQRCIGRGLLTEAGLADIHEYLLSLLSPAGGRIDHFYFAGALEDEDPLRKPLPGMALQALEDYPEIDFQKSIMVGNNPTDMEFAHNAGIRYRIFLTTTIDPPPYPYPYIDAHYPTLKAFADSIRDNQVPAGTDQTIQQQVRQDQAKHKLD